MVFYREIQKVSSDNNPMKFCKPTNWIGWEESHSQKLSPNENNIGIMVNTANPIKLGAIKE